jgi:SET domain-containing protein
LARELVEVRPCPHGRGVFAAQDIDAGTRISVFGNVEYVTNPRLLQYALQVGDSKYWDGYPEGSQLQWSNFLDHSDRPNAAFYFDSARQVRLVALERIKAGQEIFIDYVSYHGANLRSFEHETHK